MSLRFLLDTNVFSEPLRLNPNPKVMEMLRQHENAIATAVAAVVEYQQPQN